MDFGALQERIGYQFRDVALLERALTHASVPNEVPGAVDNERLEFLGDSVLGLIVTQDLFLDRPRSPEGSLSRARAARISNVALARCAVALDLGTGLRLGHGRAMEGITNAMLADTFEALAAAIYLDCGRDLAATSRVVLPLLDA